MIRANAFSSKTDPSSTPLYLKIKQDLLKRLKAGEWRPGELLPSENGFAAEYGVSVGTARKAIDELAGERLLIRQRGRGTMVALHAQRQESAKYYRLICEDGSFANQETLYLDVSRGSANRAEAAAMEIDEGASVARIVRCRLSEGRPLVCERMSLREDILPSFTELVAQAKPKIFYGFVERQYHVIIRNVAEKVTPSLASEEDEAQLGIPAGRPMLQVERRAFDLQGRCLEYRVMRARPEISYQAEIF